MTTCTSCGAELRARLIAARLTQRELAELAGVPRPNVSAYEAGRSVPNVDTTERLDRALRTPHLSMVRAVSAALIEAAARRGLSNVRVFGSVVRGEADEQCDIELLVHPDPRHPAATSQAS